MLCEKSAALCSTAAGRPSPKHLQRRQAPQEVFVPVPPRWCLTLLQFLHTAAGVNPVRRVPGSKDTALPRCWHRQCQSVPRLMSGPTSVTFTHNPCASSGRTCHNQVPARHRLCRFTLRINAGAALTGWAVPAQVPEAVCPPAAPVSSAAPGSLRSPFRGAPEPAAPHFQTTSGTNAPVAALLPRPWSFRDSKAGARIKAGNNLNDITRATVQPLRL